MSGRAHAARSPRTTGFETLEPRRLLHGLLADDHGAIALAADATSFSARINFQPPRSTVPPGYLADAGAAFGDRGNGLAYGWDAANTAYRDRDSTLSPDQRYDTFTHTQLYGTRTWELAVPDGTYLVHVVAGDPSTTNSVYAFNAEGVAVVSGKPTSTSRWVEGTKAITVTDGRLTVSNAAAAVNNKLAFLEVSPAAQAAVSVSVWATDPSAAEAGADGGAFRFVRTGDSGAPLAVLYTVTGSATAGTDYASLSGTLTIPAGALSATLALSPKVDGRAEGDETVTVTVRAGAGYAPTAPASATVVIDDADDATTAPQVATWKPLAASPVARFESASAAIGGKLYVFGGYDKNILAMSRSDLYDPAADRWSSIAPMPQPITHAGVAADAEGGAVYFAGGFVGERSFVTTANVWKYDAESNRWSALTPLPGARAAGGLVRLGHTLHFFGGASAMHTRDYGDHWVLDLDAAPGTSGAAWTALAPLPNPRNHFGYAALNGRIYAIGGQHLNNEKTGNLADVHAFDPATGQWSSVASLPLARSHNHTSTVVLNGRILLFGGQANDPYFPKTIADVTSYDPAANAWTALPPLPDVRQAVVAQAIGQKVYVTTGTNTGIHPQTTTWSRDVGGAWDAGPVMPVAMTEVAGGTIGGKMYLVGAGSGATLAYDFAGGTWSSPTALAQRPYKGDHHAAEVLNGKLYLLGGMGGGSEGKVQVYDPAANRWSVGADMPFAAGSSSSAVFAGRIYVAGGIIGSATTSRAARYDPGTNTWRELAPMPQGRNHAASATDGRRIYVFGGRGPGSGDANSVANGFDTVQIYDPIRDLWTSSAASTSTLTPLPQARGGMGKAVYYKGEFYVLGGETLTGAGATSLGVYHRVDVYNPLKNTWRLGPPLPTARHGIFPLLYAGRVYVAGGGTRAGSSSSTLLEVLNLV